MNQVLATLAVVFGAAVVLIGLLVGTAVLIRRDAASGAVRDRRQAETALLFGGAWGYLFAREEPDHEEPADGTDFRLPSVAAADDDAEAAGGAAAEQRD